ncbi:MAG TPA: aminotransferase class V-fold PLP-dependent enzyme, partial [Phycisphaerales bacterium]|nr:aminotransferase class V-fold PLP-dependent enzyme [Phycisphaerales bacterium]
RRREAPGRPVHVVTTALDHNSVLRPLAALEAAGQAEVTRVPVEAETGAAAAADVVAALRPDTCLVAVNHASNVTGAILDVAAIGAACRARGVIFLVDAAQSLGHCPLDVAEARIDLLAFPGHKGLLGPTGTGGLYIRPGIEDRLCTVREGGTGTRSEAEAHPQTMPDRFEPGSPNTVGIAGLSEAVGWMLERGIDGLRAHEAELTEALLEGLARLPGLRVPGPGARHRVGVVSMVHETLPALELATILETSFGILGRAGLHCAPLAHRALGTAPPGGGGAFRLSVGPFVSRADVNRAIEGVRAACGSAPTPPVAVARRPAPAGTIRR